MQLGACFAGLAIENSMLGAAHALANALTANYGIVHGQAVGMMLPHVVRFNAVEMDESYVDLLEVAAGAHGAPSPRTGGEGLAGFLTGLVKDAGLKTMLSELNVDRDKLPKLASEAAEQWVGKFNPRDVTKETLLELYEQAF